MIDAIISFIESKTRAKSKPPEPRVALAGVSPTASAQLKADPRDHQVGFTKVFRWPVPAGQTPQPTTVEVVGSFSGWRKVPLAYDKVTKTWWVSLDNILSNHTHQYVIVVDGKPSYDKTCDGLAAPQSPEEAKWQIDTAKGPRVMLLFAQTK